MSAATSAPTLEMLGQRVDELAEDVARVKARIDNVMPEKSMPRPRPMATPVGSEEIIAELLAEGVLVEPPPEMEALIKQLEAEWKAIPEEEQRAAEEELRNLRLDPPLSEIIIKMRGGWYPDETEWVIDPE